MTYVLGLLKTMERVGSTARQENLADAKRVRSVSPILRAALPKHNAQAHLKRKQALSGSHGKGKSNGKVSTKEKRLLTSQCG